MRPDNATDYEVISFKTLINQSNNLADLADKLRETADQLDQWYKEGLYINNYDGVVVILSRAPRENNE